MNRKIGRLTMLLLMTCWSAAMIRAQDEHAASKPEPLTVPAGVPLDVVLDKSVPIKHAGVPVSGQITEPIFVFDNMAIPAGSRVVGRVARVDSLSRKRRALAIARPPTRQRVIVRLSRAEEERLIGQAYRMPGVRGLLVTQK